MSETSAAKESQVSAPSATQDEVPQQAPGGDDARPDARGSTSIVAAHNIQSTPSLLSEEDYDAIASAVMETERGRWFLAEYAKRNRQADTQTVLHALERLESKLEERSATGDDTSVALISHNVIDLAEAITNVKREVQELGGQGDTPDHFGSAQLELEAIVEQTETATGEILEAAEKIQEVVWTLREEGASSTQCDIIESKIIDVYTACSFQDLTGQRSSKVVSLVGYVEKRVNAMMGILGINTAAEGDADNTRSETASPPAKDETNGGETRGGGTFGDDMRPDAHLLNGPALDGEGIEQNDVDALFGGSAADDATDALVGDDPTSPSAENEIEDVVSSDGDPDGDLEDDASASLSSADDMATGTDEGSPQPDGTADGMTAPSEGMAELEAEADGDGDGADTPDEIANEADGADEVAATADNVVDNDAVVELHDAEILSQPAEEALLADALPRTDEPQDIFDVETLEFESGEDAVARHAALSDKHEGLERVNGPRQDLLIIDLPDDFVVDEADMMLDEDEGPPSLATDHLSESESDPSALAQDVFEVDVADATDDVEGTSDDAQDETDEDALDTALVESERTDLTNPDTVASDADEGDDADLVTLDETLQEDGVAEPQNDPMETAHRADRDAEPAVYTDNERIALFS